MVHPTLSQIHLGFCLRLQTFQFKIGGAVDDLYLPGMFILSNIYWVLGQAYKAKESLWSNPWAVAKFLMIN